MAVQIPISATPTGAVDAIKQITDAIQRAGQAGRAFAQLDLSHPELSGMAEDIRRLAGRFQDLARVGRGGTAQAFRGVMRAAGATDSRDFLAWDANLPRVFPDQAQMARHRANVLGYVTQGTQFQPQLAPTPTPTPPAPPHPPPAGGGPGLLGSLGAGMMGFMGASLALSGISTIKQVLAESIGKAQEEAGTTDDLYRRTDLTKSFLDLRDAVMLSTKELGVNAQEAGRLSVMWARVAGESDPEAILSNVRQAVGFGRSYGMDPGTAAQAMAQATNAGLDPRTFATLVGEAASKGGRSVDETLPAMVRIAETSARMFIDHLGANLVQAGGMLASLNATGLPGMRNGGAENIMSTLGASLMNPGAGPAGQGFLYMAGQRQQGVSDPYRQQFLREGGLFSSPRSSGVGTSNVSNYEALRAEMSRQFPGDPMVRYQAMSNLTGLTMHQVRALESAGPQDLSTTVSALSHAGLDVKDLNPTAIADAVRISNAQPADLERQRQQLLGRHGQGILSAEDQTTLSQAGAGSLRDVMLQMVSKYGMAETDGSKTRESQATLSNAMTKIGQDLLPMLNDLKTGIGTLGGQLGDLGSIITDVYRAGKGDPEATDNLLFGKGGVRRGGGDRPLTDAASRETESQLMAFYQSRAGGGYTREQAAGIVAQASAESGYRAHGPAGDGGAAQGLFQWHPDRVAAIEAHFGKKLADMSLMEQAAAKAWELSEEGPEAAAGRALRQTRTPSAAGYSETVNDQRPSAKYLRGASRGQLAEDIFAAPNMTTVEGQPTARIAPLEVIHLDQQGNVLGQQQLPVTSIAPPTPWGPPRSGDKSAVPPAPPPPRSLPTPPFMGF